MTLLINDHPCFGNAAKPTAGRIHLPVSPVCNIRCRFCARAINPSAQLPGNASRVITPAEAMKALERALRICPEIKVAGIAGPGDPLASDHAEQTLALVHTRYPKLIKCLSTNGLELATRLPKLREAGVNSITVTVNAVDARILERICAGIVVDGAFINGLAGARRLIEAQWSGITLASSAGMAVKVNMVLIPGVNDQHVSRVAAAAAEWGASRINIIPLKPAREFSNYTSPGCAEIEAARQVAERYLPVHRHCRQCRADACGIPGSGVDFAREVYEDLVPVETFSHG